MIEAFKKAGISKEFIDAAAKKENQEIVINETLKRFSHLEFERDLHDFNFINFYQGQLITDYALLMKVFPYLQVMHESRVDKYIRKYENLGMSVERNSKLIQLVVYKATIEMIIPVIKDPENYKNLIFKNNLIIILNAFAFRQEIVKKFNLEKELD